MKICPTVAIAIASIFSVSLTTPTCAENVVNHPPISTSELEKIGSQLRSFLSSDMEGVDVAAWEKDYGLQFQRDDHMPAVTSDGVSHYQAISNIWQDYLYVANLSVSTSAVNSGIYVFFQGQALGQYPRCLTLPEVVGYAKEGGWTITGPLSDSWLDHGFVATKADRKMEVRSSGGLGEGDMSKEEYVARTTKLNEWGCVKSLNIFRNDKMPRKP